ncbi:MAG TPA: hypothetical protein VM101_12385 [Flavitalea sp.]|nr:hypothetical protein [Flavitalea sp.]
MKIRIQGNSIRYRLREPEVQNFKNHNSVTEIIQFGTHTSQKLRFVIQKSSCKHVSVDHADQTTTIHVPEAIANNWTDTDLVGFDAIIAITDGETLKVLVEKDFKCLDGSIEDNVGAYPNPAEQC